MPTDVMKALSQAAQGLLYPSETDAPFEPFSWPIGKCKLTPALVRQLGEHEAREPVQEISLADFFKDLTEEQDWHGKQERAAVKKFRALERTIGELLPDAKVIRVGTTEITIYIAGKTAEGNCVGLKTRAVET